MNICGTLLLLVTVLKTVYSLYEETDEIIIIHVFIPTGEVYPEHGVIEIANKAAEKIEQQYNNTGLASKIHVNVTGIQSNDKNLVSDQEISSILFNEEAAIKYCIGLTQSRVALEMATFLKIPTITYSALDYGSTLEYSSQVAINPQYWHSTKAIFNVLKEYKWSRVNFIVSSLPWYTATWGLFQKYMKNDIDGFRIEYERSDQYIFTLDSYKKDTTYFMNLIKNKYIKKSNIFVFVGHLCELRRFISTSRRVEGFLVPGKIIIYIDIFGQMALDTGKRVAYTAKHINCTNFSGWVDYNDDEEDLKEAMEYVIFGISLWKHLNDDVTSEKFAEDYELEEARTDNSGFGMLLVDSLNIMIDYISNARQNQTLKNFTRSKSVRSDYLYSGRDLTFEGSWRSLIVGVEFFHGNGDVNFMRWEDCRMDYCPHWLSGGADIKWAGDKIPVSLFISSDDEVNVTLIVLPMLFTMLFVCASALLTTHFYKKHRCRYSQKLWNLDKHDFDFNGTSIPTFTGHYGQTFPKSYRNVRNFTGKHKNCEVFIKEVCRFNTDISQSYELATELLKHVDKKNENVNFLIGIRVIADEIQIVQPYCSKGSLMDVLENNPMKINDNLEYKLHILINIARGMSYLHSTMDIAHGNLKTTNCLVDSRWVVKVSDFEPVGIRTFFEEDTSNNEMYYAQKLWTAPELLVTRNNKVTKKRLKICDVFSFAIISFQVLADTLPYHQKNDCPHSYSEIIKRVKESSEPPFRPDLKRSDCHGEEDLYKLVRNCWAQNPAIRPHFNIVCKRLENWSTGEDFGDFIATEMEKYSSGLDDKIKEMEDKLMKERHDYEKLLQKMLPRQIASCIKAGRQPPFETSEVSLYFSDIYNFSKISHLKRFREDHKLIVEFLNMLYEVLDTIVSCFQEKLYKVETINDSYLVMSGLPVRQDRDYLHAGFIANFALFVLSRVNEIELEGYPDVRVQIRIGIHSGNLAAGVIGKLNPRYCLFGDTVNFTSRLESTGKPFTIHTSKTTTDLLNKHNNLFKVVQRAGTVTLKNRGEHQTYFVVGMSGFDWELPKETLRLQQYGDKDTSDTTSVVSGHSGRTRRTSACSTHTDFSCTDTGISSALLGSSNRSKKLSSSVLEMQNSVSFSMLKLLEKMKKPADKLNEFEQERPARRAFSEPDGGNLKFDTKKQRMSTPFRKESDQSLYLRGKEERSINCLRPIQEPFMNKVDIRTHSCSSETDDPLGSQSDLEGELSVSSMKGVTMSEIYNHDRGSSTDHAESSTGNIASDKATSSELDTDDENGDEEELLDTPTEHLPTNIMQRRDTNQTLVAPSAYAIANCPMAMGVKRYSYKRKPTEFTSDTERNETNLRDGESTDIHGPGDNFEPSSIEEGHPSYIISQPTDGMSKHISENDIP